MVFATNNRRWYRVCSSQKGGPDTDLRSKCLSRVVSCFAADENRMAPRRGGASLRRRRVAHTKADTDNNQNMVANLDVAPRAVARKSHEYQQTPVGPAESTPLP
jgi:hypothetical protein